MSRPFVHLHCHSHFSLLDGASCIKTLVARARELGMNSLALTDHGNLYGALRFYRACRDAEINPVLGYEAYIAPKSRFDKGGGTAKESSYHLTLLAQNRAGFQNLIKLASRAFLEGFYHKPRIDRELLEQYNEGLVCLSGCVSGEFSRALLSGRGGHEEELARAKEIAAWFHSLFGDRYFIEIQNNGLDIQHQAMTGAVEVAQQMGLPLVATSDTHYVNREDAVAQDVLLCINTGKLRSDTNRMKMETDEFYLRGPDAMYEAFPDHGDAVRRSQRIADSVDIRLDLGKRHFPTFKPPEEKTLAGYLRQLCVEGLKERYADRPHRWKEKRPGRELSDEVNARLDRELGVIDKLGFNDYFLIVWDFVRYAAERDIPCTARGSGVGSLVCYALRMSHVCPLEYDLLFERFLDENRLEAPDIDIDFCKLRRAEVIQYVKDKYGDANVAQIGTFGTLAARMAIRDVGRTLNWPLFRVDQIVAMVPDELNIRLDDALEKSDELKKAYEDPETKELIDLARKVEGSPRNVGTHAAAVVIAERPVDEYVPLQHVKGKTEVITQWAMGDVEAAGLLKMDFLGLKNLTILAKSIELIEQTTGKRIDPYKFPLDDPDTYALLCRGETKGIFQLESGGIRDLLQRMKPDSFRDIIATNALYRPGPLEGGMVDQYIEVKHGRKKAEYPHAVMEEILAETHGVMVYQEQVMRILNCLGGIQLTNAYKCIKAISKKKLPIIAKFRETFIDGAQETGLDKKRAEGLFDMIEKFAGYGFNKCMVGDTEILDAETGERTTVGELFHNRRPFSIHALGPDNKLGPKNVADVVWNGRKRVYRLTTAQSRTLTATANHPIRTFDGWRYLGQLSPDDRVATPRRLSINGDVTWSPHEVVVLGGLLSEGNTCHPTCLYFYNNDQVLIDDFVSAVQQFDNTKARIDIRRGNRMEVCVSTGKDARFKPGRRSPATNVATATVVAPSRSGAFQWAERLGILGKRATEKSVPDDVFRFADAQIELFLGRLWSGDGFVGAPGQMPFYATSSPQLAADVQTLLLRLGMVSGIRSKIMRYIYKGEQCERPGYTVHLVGAESVRTYVRRVLSNVIGRDTQIEEYRNYLETHAPATSKDTIPAEVRCFVDEERKQAGLTWRQLESESGVSVKELVGSGSKQKKGFRRDTIAKLGAFFESVRLCELAGSDIFWDRVTSIEPVGVEDTYDLTVEKDHNFVADGLVVHNSHSTAYALIAYMTAYLKAHYPVEFMASLLSGDIPGRNFKSKDSLVEHLEDCQRMEIEVVPPDVNRSGVDFEVKEDKIHFALSAIKSCGVGAAEAIVAARENEGPFRDLFDLCERVDPRDANKASVETLVKAGALDRLGGHRAQFLAGVERAMQSGAAAAADRRSGQKSLFDDFEDEEETDAGDNLPDVPKFNEKELLTKEKEVLGFYLSSHPLDAHDAMLQTYCSHTTKQLGSLDHRSEVLVGGMLAAVTFKHTKKPRPGSTQTKYAMWDLEDKSGMVRCILWPEQFAQFDHLVQPDAILAMRAAVDRRPGSEETNLIINELIPLDDLATRFTSGVLIRIDEARHGEERLVQLKEILRGYPGDKRLNLRLELADGGTVHLDNTKTGLEINPELRQLVDDLLGVGNFRLLGAAPPKNGRGSKRNGR